ncbi:hypothetical protein CC78DRAFT_104268 [Lojkania enalia]|uniref:Uncharacterized protein n=1 Tax=Lojkania enalia TaxID=147567 RepID=A0A9P4KFN6_9PLEO|nr:hypothetical protein CC78DRAFT_104268 [Didymosphaeria enalia]
MAYDSPFRKAASGTRFESESGLTLVWRGRRELGVERRSTSHLVRSGLKRSWPSHTTRRTESVCAPQRLLFWKCSTDSTPYCARRHSTGHAMWAIRPSSVARRQRMAALTYSNDLRYTNRKNLYYAHLFQHTHYKQTGRQSQNPDAHEESQYHPSPHSLLHAHLCSLSPKAGSVLFAHFLL